jgi:hypothetical protein
MSTLNGDGRVRVFSDALNAYPARFTGNPLNLLFVEDAHPIFVADEYLRQLDAPSLMEERREYLIDSSSPWPFPPANLDSRPDPRLISELLFERFDDAKILLPTQQDIGRRLEHHARRTNPAIVALVIVDGLSYYDLPACRNVDPCLVAGLTSTEFGYRAVVGDPSVSRRMFALGYVNQAGFSYYAPEANDLSADIHDTISGSQFVKVRAFDEVLMHLRERRLLRGYVQIVLSGLDYLCHQHRDRPPVDHYLEEILSRFDALLESLSEGGRSVLGCLTADHGILWRDVVEDEVQVADDIFQEDIRSPRYIRGAILRPYGRCCRCLDRNLTLLKSPWMTRGFRANEWGVHGGISAWESLVPLIIRRV